MNRIIHGICAFARFVRIVWIMPKERRDSLHIPGAGTTPYIYPVGNLRGLNLDPKIELFLLPRIMILRQNVSCCFILNELSIYSIVWIFALRNHVLLFKIWWICWSNASNTWIDFLMQFILLMEWHVTTVN